MNHASVESHASTRHCSRYQDHPDDAHLSAYNAAFSDLGLRFRWDRATLDFSRNSTAKRLVLPPTSSAFMPIFIAHTTPTFSRK